MRSLDSQASMLYSERQWTTGGGHVWQGVELDEMIREYKWSTVSLAISIGATARLFCVIQYFYRVHGIQDFRWLSPLVAAQLSHPWSLAWSLSGRRRVRRLDTVRYRRRVQLRWLRRVTSQTG